MTRLLRTTTTRSASYCCVLLSLLVYVTVGITLTPEQWLSRGDEALAGDQISQAIDFYQQGIQGLQEEEEGEESSLLSVISLHTNLGTALSTIGQTTDAIESYKTALLRFDKGIDEIVDKSYAAEAKAIAAQTTFFLGMEYQEINNPRKAADAYAFANTLDPYHWASLANLGAVLYDELKQTDDALVAYNQAIELLTQKEEVPTDAPPEPSFVLSELHYRVGLCLTRDPNRKCARTNQPDQHISCQELATNAFSLATEYNPRNELAKHMLATLTADATMTRASNDYVKLLFDDYARSFEHSLVDELSYTGFERIRRVFNRAFGGEDNVPTFSIAVDAGCGTGLAGEQFRNVSSYLVGVDLSEAILDEANRKRPGLYNETRVGDITDVFRELHPISLILAADSYIYFGDLEPLFASMEDGLGPLGYAVFTMENVGAEAEQALMKTKPDWRWQLTASGRFAHRKEYVESMAQRHQFRVVHYEPLDSFRYENGIGVQGHAFVLQKKAEAPDL